ncbi:MAG: tryptophan halogenase [Gammaproteobacteria bacterium]|nr:MAG: tryptophan halogenase [Gammaproteobacteria bacterium]
MSKPNHIVIVGGGTAGWMAANLMAQAWQSQGIKITVIESTRIGTIGVGEGSTPYLRQFFHRLNIPEAEWMPACHATFKCGISFPDWSTNKGYENYFHPFYSMIDAPNAPLFFENCSYRRQGSDVFAHPNDFFVTSKLAQAKKSPIAATPPRKPVEYGYHFDAELLGQYLAKKALEKGVNHIDDKVLSVETIADGSISHLITENSGELHADFFVDCSGFSGLLIQQTLGEKITSKKGYLKCDSAVALPTPLNLQNNVPSETVSKALKYGWVWNIPLTKRFGNGYVYCSDYISKAEAEAELRQHLGMENSDAKAVHLHWQPGRLENHWRKNCVAIGLSQGFLEPLEAPMLYLVQRTTENFIAYFQHENFNSDLKTRFNREINLLIDGTVDYLQAHYKANTRDDSQFWIDCRENTCMSPSLSAILSGWDESRNFEMVMQEQANTQVYQRASWYCLLAGMGRFKPISEADNNVNKNRAEQNHQNANQDCTAQSEVFIAHNEHLRTMT